MAWVNWAATFVVQTLLQEGIAVIFGVLVANLIIKKMEGKLLIRDGVKREYVIDLDYNPQKDVFDARL